MVPQLPIGWNSLSYNGPHVVTTSYPVVCPDLLRYEQIGEADNFRGRVVRAFFWIMRAWPVQS